MKWATHRRITKEVFNQLKISLSYEEYGNLMEGVVAPDKLKDYPHHYSKSSKIQDYLLKARLNYLQNDRLTALYNLGVALHYIQDSYTTYPSFLRKHEDWESWIEECDYVPDVERAIQQSVKNKSVKNLCMRVSLELSGYIDGKNATLRAATLYGHEKNSHTIASPIVDYNLGYRASLVVVKSIIGEKGSPSLDSQLNNVLNDYNIKLFNSENEKVNHLFSLIGDNSRLRSRIVQSDGLISKIRNWIIQKRIARSDNYLNGEKIRYFNKEHLHLIQRQYEIEVNRICNQHINWYHYKIPFLDTTLVRSELLELKNISSSLKIDEIGLRNYIKEGKISIFTIGNTEFVRRAEFDRRLDQKSIDGFQKYPY